MAKGFFKKIAVMSGRIRATLNAARREKTRKLEEKRKITCVNPSGMVKMTASARRRALVYMDHRMLSLLVVEQNALRILRHLPC